MYEYFDFDLEHASFEWDDEKAQKFSKSYGKGYTTFLSRLIDAALDDASLVKKCL